MGYSRDSHWTFRIFVAWCSALLVGIVNSGNIDFRNLGFDHLKMRRIVDSISKDWGLRIKNGDMFQTNSMTTWITSLVFECFGFSLLWFVKWVVNDFQVLCCLVEWWYNQDRMGIYLAPRRNVFMDSMGASRGATLMLLTLNLFTWYPLVNYQFAIENRNSWYTHETGDFPSFFVCLPEGNNRYV